jgi:peptidoglycan hydrolase-like protein with peptidoglycan-binding domain
MRTLILATASAIALGLAGVAPTYAADTNATPPAPAASPATATPATGAAQPSMPQTGATTQPATPSANTSSQFNHPYMADTSASNSTSWHATRSDVRRIQEKLRADNLYRGRIDGRMGPQTRQALRQYQSKNGLPVTARLDQDTVNSLLGTGAGQGSSTPPASSNGTTPSPSSGAGTTGHGSWNANSPANPK